MIIERTVPMGSVTRVEQSELMRIARHLLDHDAAMFTWEGGWTRFDTVMIPSMAIAPLNAIPYNRVLVVLVNFRKGWHFDVDEPSADEWYVAEKLGLSREDAQHVVNMIAMVSDQMKELRQ